MEMDDFLHCKLGQGHDNIGSQSQHIALLQPNNLHLNETCTINVCGSKHLSVSSLCKVKNKEKKDSLKNTNTCLKLVSHVLAVLFQGLFLSNPGSPGNNVCK